MATRSSWPGNVVFGEEATKALIDKIPGGLIAYAEVTANQTGITTEVDLTGLSLTVTLPADRIITVDAYCFRISSATSDDLANFRIKEGGTQLAESRVDVGNNSAGNGGTFGRVETAPITPTAGAHTYKCTLSLAAGTGDLAFRAGASSPAWIRVIDWGPAF